MRIGKMAAVFVSVFSLKMSFHGLPVRFAVRVTRETPSKRGAGESPPRDANGNHFANLACF